MREARLILTGLVASCRWPGFDEWLAQIRPEKKVTDPMEALAFLGG